MIGMLRWYIRLGRLVYPYVPLLLEFAVTLASLRMAAALLARQDYFEIYPSFYHSLVQHMLSEEWAWGLLALLAGGLKAGGMAMTIFGWRGEVGYGLRILGWSAGTVFWLFFCISITVGDPWSLGSCLALPMFLLSLGGLMMGPAVPEPLDARE
jgi:hypothetical protein